MTDKQSILFMYGSRGTGNWWWLQKNRSCNIGSHFTPYKWDTKKSTTRKILIEEHGWIPVAGHGLVGWEDGG